MFYGTLLGTSQLKDPGTRSAGAARAIPRSLQCRAIISADFLAGMRVVSILKLFWKGTSEPRPCLFNTLANSFFVATFPVFLRPLLFTRRASSSSSQDSRTKQTLPPFLLIVLIVFFTKGSSVALSYTNVKIMFTPCLAACSNIDSRYFSMSFQYGLVPYSKTDLTKSIET